MTALRKILVEEEVVAAPVARAPKLYVVTNAAPVETAPPEAGTGAFKNILLFFAAPFFGLAYIIALPLVGLAVVAVLLARLAAARFPVIKHAALVLRNVALTVAAPLVGLLYVVFFPFIGLAALAWLGTRTVTGNAGAA